MVDIAKKAFAKHNIEVEYKIIPWARAITETRKGLHTAIVGAAVGDAPDFIFPDAEQGFVSNYFYVNKGNKWRYSGVKSLKEISLGVIADYSYNEEIDDYIKQYNKYPEYIQIMAGDNALAINLSKLKRNKIGATLESRYVMEYYLSQNNMKNLFEPAGMLELSEEDKLYVAFSPKDKRKAKKYADILTKETVNMRKSGELQEIMDIYGIVDWQNTQN